MALVAGSITAASYTNRLWFPVQFAYVAAGGIVVGLLVGWAVDWIRKRSTNDDPQMALTMSLAIPFISYLAADVLNMSGVLAVVATGFHVGWKAPRRIPSRIRLQSRALWDTIIYVLNGMIFILIGLQLPGIIHGMREFWWPRPFLYAVVINLVCILVRIAWVFPGAYLPRLLSRRIRASEGKPDWRHVFIVSWSGMRGVVSLAAALALNGYPSYPRSHLTQFLSFSVILTTLVFQGLTLPWIIRVLKVGDDGVPAREEHEARERISSVVFERIGAIRYDPLFPLSAVDRLEQFYRERDWRLMEEGSDHPDWQAKHHHSVSLGQLHQRMISEQRRALLEMREKLLIGDDVLHKIEHELDLEETHLMGQRK